MVGVSEARWACFVVQASFGTFGILKTGITYIKHNQDIVVHADTDIDRSCVGGIAHQSLKLNLWGPPFDSALDKTHILDIF